MQTDALCYTQTYSDIENNHDLLDVIIRSSLFPRHYQLATDVGKPA